MTNVLWLCKKAALRGGVEGYTGTLNCLYNFSKNWSKIVNFEKCIHSNEDLHNEITNSAKSGTIWASKSVIPAMDYDPLSFLKQESKSLYLYQIDK